MFKSVAELIARLSGRGASGRAEPEPFPPPDEAEVLEDLRRFVEGQVAAGYMPLDEIAQAGWEYLEGEADEALLRREAERLTREAAAAHAAAMATWPAVTDCDRLDAAFAALEASGILARQDWTCCGTCGVAEMADEAKAALREGRRPHGYVFFHAQDTERAVEGEGVFLNYGSTEGDDDAAVAVGHQIVGALKAQGLEPKWDGSLGRRIELPLDWKRRPRPAPVWSGVA